MVQYIEMKLGGNPVLIEIAESGERGEKDHNQFAKYRGETIIKVTKKLDQALDNIIQQQIINHCKSLNDAFSQLKEQAILPKKASFEFGLQLNCEGNICITKVSGQSSFKISFEWEF